ncbi:YchJ family protein [Massilia sp. S19_KUP03_FR1]|uniref:YchJ family protein n=1 Tax=Massilia sp. S19_KUP03_FR1 TaxID=3025503 RepID=UPI002FCDBF69
MPMPISPSLCPCGGGPYAQCCAPYLGGASVPQTAEQLMRSRYSAYTLRDEAYLRATWHASTLPPGAIVDPDEKLQWLGLEVKSALRLRQRKADLPEEQQAGEARDTVEFVARFKVGGRAHRLHEVSRFVRAPDSLGALRWFYVDGSFPEK